MVKFTRKLINLLREKVKNMKTKQRVICLLLCLLTVFSAFSLSLEAAAITVNPTSKITATATSNTVELTWKKVAKATGYRVYQKKDGKWTAIRTQSATKYVVKNLTASTNYTFCVKAYRKYDGKTYWSSLKSVKVKTQAMPKITTPKATSNKTSVTLKWSAVAGATGYRVYQYQNKKWVKLKDVTAKSYTVKSLKNETTYYFKVKPYAKTDSGVVWGATSSKVTIKTSDPTKAKFTSASSTQNSITLKWGKVSGATGYRLFVKNNGEWKKVATTSSLTYTVKKLKAKTSYTYMVRAYKNIDGKITWYPKSDSKTVKTKAASTETTTTTKPTTTTTKPTTTTTKPTTTTTKPTTTKPTTTKPTTTKPTTTTTKPTTTTTKPTTTTTKPTTTTTKPTTTTTKPTTTTTKPTTTTTKPTTTKPTTTKPTTTKPTTTKPTTTKPTTTKPTTTKPTTTKPTTTKPTTTKLTTTKPTTTKPTTTKPTTTKPTTTKPTTTKPTTTKPTTTKPTTTKPTTTQPTTYSPYELTAFRLRKYQKILDSDTIYFKISSDNGSGGTGDIEYAQKDGNIYCKAVDDGMTAKMYYEKKTDKMYAYFLLFYYEVPKSDWKDMDITAALEDMKIKNLGFVNISEEKFNGKNVICESYRDNSTGIINKYYFEGETLIGIEKVYGSTHTTIYVDTISNTFDESILKRPTSGYGDISSIV